MEPIPDGLCAEDRAEYILDHAQALKHCLQSYTYEEKKKFWVELLLDLPEDASFVRTVSQRIEQMQHELNGTTPEDEAAPSATDNATVHTVMKPFVKAADNISRMNYEKKIQQQWEADRDKLYKSIYDISADFNSFVRQYASNFDAIPAPKKLSPHTMVVISSNVVGSDLLALAVLDGLVTITYSFEDSLDGLMAQITEKTREFPIRHIALICTGLPGEVAVTQDVTITMETIQEDSALREFWHRIGAILGPENRIKQPERLRKPASSAHAPSVHIFSPMLLESVEGDQLVKRLQRVCKVDIFVSNELTAPHQGHVAFVVGGDSSKTQAASPASTASSLFFHRDRLNAWKVAGNNYASVAHSCIELFRASAAKELRSVVDAQITVCVPQLMGWNVATSVVACLKEVQHFLADLSTRTIEHGSVRQPLHADDGDDGAADLALNLPFAHVHSQDLDTSDLLHELADWLAGRASHYGCELKARTHVNKETVLARERELRAVEDRVSRITELQEDLAHALWELDEDVEVAQLEKTVAKLKKTIAIERKAALSEAKKGLVHFGGYSGYQHTADPDTTATGSDDAVPSTSAAQQKHVPTAPVGGENAEMVDQLFGEWLVSEKLFLGHLQACQVEIDEYQVLCKMTTVDLVPLSNTATRPQTAAAPTGIQFQRGTTKFVKPEQEPRYERKKVPVLSHQHFSDLFDLFLKADRLQQTLTASLEKLREPLVSLCELLSPASIIVQDKQDVLEAVSDIQPSLLGTCQAALSFARCVDALLSNLHLADHVWNTAVLANPFLSLIWCTCFLSRPSDVTSFVSMRSVLVGRLKWLYLCFTRLAYRLQAVELSVYSLQRSRNTTADAAVLSQISQYTVDILSVVRDTARELLGYHTKCAKVLGRASAPHAGGRLERERQRSEQLTLLQRLMDRDLPIEPSYKLYGKTALDDSDIGHRVVDRLYVWYLHIRGTDWVGQAAVAAPHEDSGRRKRRLSTSKAARPLATMMDNTPETNQMCVMCKVQFDRKNRHEIVVVPLIPLIHGSNVAYEEDAAGTRRLSGLVEHDAYISDDGPRHFLRIRPLVEDGEHEHPEDTVVIASNHALAIEQLVYFLDLRNEALAKSDLH